MFLNATLGQFHISLRNCEAHWAMASSAPAVTLLVRERSEFLAEVEASIALDREEAQGMEEAGEEREVRMRGITVLTMMVGG